LAPADSFQAAMQIAHGDPGVGRPLRRWRADAVFMTIGFLFCLVGAPQFYAWVVHQFSHTPITRPVALHLMANGCANFLVGVGAWSARGRLDEKLGRALYSVLVAHGLLALVVVLTHSVYSNIVMLSAVGVSVGWGLAVAVTAHVVMRPRIAVVGPFETHPEHLPPHVERIADPSLDLRPYDLVLTASADQLPAEWMRAISRVMMAGKPVRHCAAYLEEARGLVSLEHFEVDQLTAGGLASYQPGKRALDLGIAALALPFAAPLVLVAGLAIWATSGRPVFFVQPRVGLGGRNFRIFKLRTMTVARDGAPQTVTRLGQWLRLSRIDELPQLWNVLVGEMSFIGPRPEWTVLAERYSAQLPAYAYRHLVRPGITGWAQVRSGYAGDLSETRLKVAYDLFYLKHFSFALDLQVLLRTVFLFARGAR